MWPLADAALAKTPVRLFLADRLDRRLVVLNELRAGLSERTGVDVRLAYSLKTNPDPRVLRPVQAADWWVEVISDAEYDLARRYFEPGSIIRNGPVPGRGDRAVRWTFADSEGALAAAAPALNDEIGLRLRPNGGQSRFGIELTDDKALSRVAALLRSAARPIAVSMHVQASVVGKKTWRTLAATFLRQSEQLARCSGAPVRVVNFGGGFEPHDLDVFLERDAEAHIDMARGKFPALEVVVLEPGKALVQDAMALVARAVEIRRRGRPEIVVDAALADLPMARYRRHPVWARRFDGRWLQLVRGDGRILGRTCMEHDIVATAVDLPSWIEVDTPLLFDACGAYDASMAHRFGLG
ncbi:MAG: hypothetical protein KDB53_20680 [Planctomycetes bacterium]|nr:hypothetical protein [Planctomycetota bacterium]